MLLGSGTTAPCLCDDARMTEDEAFDGVLRLVSAGEYRDLRHEPIPPAAEVAKIARSSQTGWHLQYFTRGTPEYVAARDTGLLEPLPSLTPASRAAVAKAEEAIGYPLPALLRRLYLEVGNGRFGPGYGISDVNCLIRARGLQPESAQHRAARADLDLRIWLRHLVPGRLPRSSRPDVGMGWQPRAWQRTAPAGSDSYRLARAVARMPIVDAEGNGTRTAQA
jgi:hypothetical protein